MHGCVRVSDILLNERELLEAVVSTQSTGAKPDAKAIAAAAAEKALPPVAVRAAAALGVASGGVAYHQILHGTVHDVEAADFIASYAKHLKRSTKFTLPKWVDYVKTGPNKQLAPYDPDWYYIRAASIARRIYLKGASGVGSFRKVYGGNKYTGSRPARFCKASGGIIRTIMRQLERSKILQRVPNGGRKITHLGRRTLDNIALQVMSTNAQVKTPIVAH
eukprot:TRINITY_DN171_c0_g1_i5.p2 TRINITY_DN171_c0_g1~~TRINITY_DN171_c0_g1_i5.p2  ORF type:complete len:220 (-),score=54.22 TRINITY_DN171_c0_g1_i5:103-762(-)